MKPSFPGLFNRGELRRAEDSSRKRSIFVGNWIFLRAELFLPWDDFAELNAEIQDMFSD